VGQKHLSATIAGEVEFLEYLTLSSLGDFAAVEIGALTETIPLELL